LATPFFFEEIVLLAVLAAVLSIDDKAGWQGLFAQPVIAGTLVGLVLGETQRGVEVGLVLELVWLSILPMRGTRRPDSVTGVLMGAGVTCLLAKHTGDPRTVFLVSVGVLVGLLTGEVAGVVGRWLIRFRDNRLALMSIPFDRGDAAVARKLGSYHVISMLYLGLAHAAMIAAFLPLWAIAGERFTAVSTSEVVIGAGRWVELLPAIGAASIIQLYWQKQLNRYLILATGVVLVLLWFN
jgi:fructoselysine and glucoselysine-specific PTS system IIC component